jgi:hypothetical protein
MPPISQQDVEKALEEIKRDGMCRNRRSTVYCLVAGERHYPPKQVLRLAHRHRYGTELARAHGGEPTNRPLRNLGFTVGECKQIPECQSWIKASR